MKKKFKFIWIFIFIIPIFVVFSCSDNNKVTKPILQPTKKVKINKPIVTTAIITNIFNILNEKTINDAKRRSLLNKANINYNSTTSSNLFKPTITKYILDVSYPKNLIKSSRIVDAKPGKVISKKIILNRIEFEVLSEFYTKEFFMKLGKNNLILPVSIKHDRAELTKLINKIKPSSHWFNKVIEK
ncbi:MAG: hypothetical protein GY679_03675 [Mycoplasma sp.]|nr:hypothetical protein [Mycoplasma sp.]